MCGSSRWHQSLVSVASQPHSVGHDSTAACLQTKHTSCLAQPTSHKQSMTAAHDIHMAVHRQPPILWADSNQQEQQGYCQAALAARKLDGINNDLRACTHEHVDAGMHARVSSMLPQTPASQITHRPACPRLSVAEWTLTFHTRSKTQLHEQHESSLHHNPAAQQLMLHTDQHRSGCHNASQRHDHH